MPAYLVNKLYKLSFFVKKSFFPSQDVLAITNDFEVLIAINAAFMAADRNKALEMKHILQAVKREYLKLEKTLTEAEIKNWL